LPTEEPILRIRHRTTATPRGAPREKRADRATWVNLPALLSLSVGRNQYGERRIPENPNRQRQDGDHREAGRADQGPHGVLKVLPQRGEEREAALGAMGFHGLADAAELAQRRVTRLFMPERS
jgi:hypothetical protein